MSTLSGVAPLIMVRVRLFRSPSAGIPEDRLKQIFMPFYTTKKDGTGLGLWISRGIVERYGGDIRAANRDDGTRGARFTVVLRAEEP